MSNPQRGHPNDPRYAQPYGRDMQHRGSQEQSQGDHSYGQGGNYQTPQYQSPQHQGYQQPNSGYGSQEPSGQQYSQGYGDPQYSQQGQQGGRPDPVVTRALNMASPSAEYGHQAGNEGQTSHGGYSQDPSAQDYYSQQSGGNSVRDSQRAQMFHADPGAGGHNVPQGDSGYADPRFVGHDVYEQQRAGFESFRGDAVGGGFGSGDGQVFGAQSENDPMFAPVGQADANFYESDYDEDYEEETGGGKRMLIAASILGVIGVAGAVGYAYNAGMLGGGKAQVAGSAPLIVADSQPAKEKPEVSGGKEFPNRGKLFYDRLGEADNPVTGSAAKPERIVSREEPVMGSGGSAPEAAKPAMANNASGGPRKVQTLKVLPDGRIVKTTSTATPSNAQAVPEMKATNVKTVKPQIIQQAAAPSATAAISSTPARKVVIPSPVTQSAAMSGYVVQVAARRNEADALSAFGQLQKKYPSILSSYRPNIQQTDLGDKGVWYRLRVGPMDSKDSASAVCNELKAAGHSGCFVKAL